MFFGKSKKNKNDEEIIKRTILIVDDNTVDRNLLKAVLIRQNYNVIAAKEGVEGYLLAKKHKPDLILSDCRMPEMNGIEMFNLLRQGKETADIPFVFLTTMGTPSEMVKCFEMGAENYICKPINPKMLTSQIEEILEDYLSD